MTALLHRNPQRPDNISVVLLPCPGVSSSDLPASSCLIITSLPLPGAQAGPFVGLAAFPAQDAPAFTPMPRSFSTLKPAAAEGSLSCNLKAAPALGFPALFGGCQCQAWLWVVFDAFLSFSPNHICAYELRGVSTHPGPGVAPGLQQMLTASLWRA